MKKTMIVSLGVIALLSVYVVSFVSVIKIKNKRISELEKKEPKVVYVEVFASESDSEVGLESDSSAKEDEKIYYTDDSGNIFEFIAIVYNSYDTPIYFIQNVETKDIMWEADWIFVKKYYILEDYQP